MKTNGHPLAKLMFDSRLFTYNSDKTNLLEIAVYVTINKYMKQ